MTLRRLRFALPLAFVVLLVDCTTKEFVVESLTPHAPQSVAGDVVRFTLVYNPDAAMGLPLGTFGRWPLILLGLCFVASLLFLLWSTPPHDRRQRLALGLVLGGALGNLLSRVRYVEGVVDFIDIGVGSMRFYIFNVADIGLFVGGVLLALSLWRAPAPPSQGVAVQP